MEKKLAAKMDHLVPSKEGKKTTTRPHCIILPKTNTKMKWSFFKQNDFAKNQFVYFFSHQEHKEPIADDDNDRKIWNWTLAKIFLKKGILLRYRLLLKIFNNKVGENCENGGSWSLQSGLAYRLLGRHQKKERTKERKRWVENLLHLECLR